MYNGSTPRRQILEIKDKSTVHRHVHTREKQRPLRVLSPIRCELTAGELQLAKKLKERIIRTPHETLVMHRSIIDLHQGCRLYKLRLL